MDLFCDKIMFYILVASICDAASIFSRPLNCKLVKLMEYYIAHQLQNWVTCCNSYRAKCFAYFVADCLFVIMDKDPTCWLALAHLARYPRVITIAFINADSQRL